MFSLTSELEKAITWLEDFQQHDEFIDPESRFLQILSLLKEIKEGGTADADIQIAQLEADRDRIQQEIELFVRRRLLIRLVKRSYVSDWMMRSPLKVIDNHGKWPELIKVCQYFAQNSHPHLYIRELTITVHAKFVEENKRILRTLLEEILPDEYL